MAVNITREAFEAAEGDYQLSYEEYLNAPGRFYSNSTEEDRKLWDRAYALIDQHGTTDPGCESKENELGDLVDFLGLIDHTGCVENGLESIIDYETTDDAGIAEVEAFLAEWRRYIARVPNAVR